MSSLSSIISFPPSSLLFKCLFFRIVSNASLSQIIDALNFFVRNDTAFCEAINERLFTANIPLENAIDRIVKQETKENTPETRSKRNYKNFAIDFRTVLSIRLRLFYLQKINKFELVKIRDLSDLFHRQYFEVSFREEVSYR